jgi:hypothetical protein
LFARILGRRSCKEPFDDRPVPAPLVARLAGLADIVTDPSEVAALRRLTWEAWKTEAYTPRTLKESIDLMRFGKSEIEANPDGIDLGGPFLEALMLAGVVGREAQLDTSSTGFREGLRIYEDMLMATPAYVVVTTQGNARADQIAAGRLAQAQPRHHGLRPGAPPGQPGAPGIPRDGAALRRGPPAPRPAGRDRTNARPPGLWSGRAPLAPLAAGD